MKYEVKESARAKHLRITIDADGQVVITKPARARDEAIEKFVHAHKEWIKEMRVKFKKRSERSEKAYGKPILLPKLRRGTKAYKDAIERARALVKDRVTYFATAGSFSYTSVSIRNQKTRWGSCSARSGLSFNYRLIYLSPDQLDYLVVHELSHTKHHNHSTLFWKEVGTYIPEYETRRRELHRYRF